MVQQQVKAQFVRVENKEFAFTKLMTCGLCGSEISADEKFKKLKSGSVIRGLKQFEELMNKRDIDETGMNKKIKEEVGRSNKFQQILLGNKEKIAVADIDIRNYGKYILREGKDVDKGVCSVV